jgi:hypothetical protein
MIVHEGSDCLFLTHSPHLRPAHYLQHRLSWRNRVNRALSIHLTFNFKNYFSALTTKLILDLALTISTTSMLPSPFLYLRFDLLLNVSHFVLDILDDIPFVPLIVLGMLGPGMLGLWFRVLWLGMLGSGMLGLWFRVLWLGMFGLRMLGLWLGVLRLWMLRLGFRFGAFGVGLLRFGMLWLRVLWLGMFGLRMLGLWLGVLRLRMLRLRFRFGVFGLGWVLRLWLWLWMLGLRVLWLGWMLGLWVFRLRVFRLWVLWVRFGMFGLRRMLRLWVFRFGMLWLLFDHLTVFVSMISSHAA